MASRQGSSNVSGAAGSGSSRGLLACKCYFALYLAASFGYAALCPPAEFAYDLSLLRAVLIAASSSVALWLLHGRRAVARWWSLGTVIICVLLSAADLMGLGAIADAAKIVSLPVASFVTALEYFGAGFVSYALVFDHSVVEALNTKLTLTPAYTSGHSWDVDWHLRIRSWEFWRDLLIYFIVFSFLGHWAEILFCRLIIAGVFMGDYDPTNAMLWDQWLFPFSAEGTALACVVLILHPAKEALLRKFGGDKRKALGISFLLNMAVCTSIDFATGMVANQHYELWDYRRMPFNFMGQVCLQNSLVYSIAATLIVWVVYPVMDTGLRRLPKDVADGLFWALAGTYVFLAALHFLGG
jgi:hypothetical protein